MSDSPTESAKAASAGLGRASALMASGTLASRILGVVRQSMLGVVIGITGLAGDAFSVANTLPNSINLLLAGGVLNAVLVPQIIKAAKHPDGGEDFVNRLLTLSLLLMAVTTALAIAAAPLLVRLYTQTANPGALHLATVFAYLCLPQIFFYGLYTLLGNVLNARDRFAAFMWAPALANVVSIAGLALFWVLGYPRGVTDPERWTTGMIWVLAGTMTLSIVAQGIVLIIPLRRTGFRYRPRFGFRGVGLRSASRVALWSFAGIAIGQVAFIVTSKVLTRATALAEAEGVTAAGKFSYDNAFLLFMLPHSLVTVSLTTALFVRLAKAAHAGHTGEVLADLSRGLRMPAPLLVPISLAGVLFAPLAVFVFFGQSRADTLAVAHLLTAMLLGLLPFGWVYLVQRVFYAYEDARTPFHIQLLIAAIATVFNLIGAALPATQTGLWVGIGQSVSNTVGAGFGFWLLRRRVGRLGLTMAMRTNVRLALASIGAAALTYAVLRAIPDSLTTNRLGALLVLGVLGALYLAVAWAIAHWMRVREVDDLVRPVTRRLARS